MYLKLLMGGSPCTYWSIAQTKNRETEASGLGWELFKNYVIAREKYKPDYFLYENNKSMSPAIRAQITHELGMGPVLINSALVSAQSRQRLYWVGRRNPDGSYSAVNITQPQDRGILLRDILESGVCWTEKGYCLKAQYYKSSVANALAGHFSAPMVAEPGNVTADGKARTLRASYHKDGIRNLVGNTVDLKTYVAEPVRIGTIESEAKNADLDSQQYRVYSPDGKSVTLCGQGGGVGAKTGLYAVPCAAAWRGREDGAQFEIRDDGKSNAVIVGHQSRLVIEAADGKTYPIYRVQDGQITINGKDYPMMMALLKVARIATGSSPDSFVDLAGYAACAGEIVTGRATQC